MIQKLSRYLLVIMSICFFYKGHAHDADKAYFDIEIEGANTLVYAEFPWSLRKVVDNFKTDGSEKNLQEKLVLYIKEHLRIEDGKGKALAFVSLELIKNVDADAHHHSQNYKITYQGTTAHKITNTLMCDYYAKQLNYHTIPTDEAFYITNAAEPSFNFKISAQSTTATRSYYYWALGLLALILVGAYILRSRRSKAH